MVKLFEAFSGIGSQTQALKNLGIEHEVVGISEIDKYAIKSYELIHGDVKNYGDISKLSGGELPIDIDIFTYSFPCQDLSIAGNNKGIVKGNRSGLLYEVERVLKEMEHLPKILLLENVKNLVGKKHKEDFYIWLNELEKMGYTNTWKVLNAKDYGIPQNRERIFVVSNLNGNEYVFPDPLELKYKIRDFLEKEIEGSKLPNDTKETNNYFQGVNLTGEYTTQCHRYYKINKIIGTISTFPSFKITDNIQERKLTTRECWRLMGFTDEQFNKVDGKLSNAQLYKQAGNSIVVNVLEAIFNNLDVEPKHEQMLIYDYLEKGEY